MGGFTVRSVNDIANLFIDLANNGEEEFMTNLRLNKLLYFAQGWSMALLDKPLFSDEIEAWKYGPVVPAVYDEFKSYSGNPIDKAEQSYMEVPFEDDELELLLDVYEEYKKYSSAGLVDITHRKNSPWSEGFVDGERVVIPKETIKTYFEKQEQIHPLPRRSIRFTSENVISKRNPQTGRVVLPKEWTDDDSDYDK